MPQSYFKDVTHRGMSQAALVAEPGIEPKSLNSSHLLKLTTSTLRREKNRNTVSYLAVTEQRLRPCKKGSVSQPTNLFARCL